MFKSYLIDLSFVFLFLMLTTLFRKITVNVMIVVKVVVKFQDYYKLHLLLLTRKKNRRLFCYKEEKVINLRIKHSFILCP